MQLHEICWRTSELRLLCSTLPVRNTYMTLLRNSCVTSISALLAISLVLSGRGGSPPKTVELKGAGATFPYPAYSKWISEYKQERPSVTIDYRPVGSGQGIEDLATGKIDFAGSDIPLTDEQMGKFQQKPLHFPTLIGAVVPIYNVPGAGELNFSGETLADILMGRITSWSD